MLNFKKNKVLLLKTLRNIVTDEIDNASIDPSMEEEVAEFLTDVKDKRKVRQLKAIRKELDTFIKEVESSKKLQEEEVKYYEEKRIKSAEVLSERFNTV